MSRVSGKGIMPRTTSSAKHPLLRAVCVVCASVFAGAWVAWAAGGDAPWHALDTGLQVGRFEPPAHYASNGVDIVVLRIDPGRYRFRLLSASEHGKRARSLKQWSEEFGLIAAINASMYQDEDMLKSTGYMRNFGHTNNPAINPVFGAFMVFNPMDPSLPPVQLIDRRTNPDWRGIIDSYHTVVQNYRMITDGTKRGWEPGKKSHSIAAIAMDEHDNVLFILSPSPYSTHDFINILLELPLRITAAMYLEGGSEAVMHYKEGSRETNPLSTFKSESALRLPNIIGVVEKK